MTSTYALVIHGGSLGVLGWWSDVCIYLEECCFFLGLFKYFDQGFSFRFLFLRVDCERNRPSFLATVFYRASVFDGDLSQWDVATVNDMSWSKSIRIVENDLS